MATSYVHMRKLSKLHQELPPQDLIEISNQYISDQQIDQIGRGYLMSQKKLPDFIKIIFEKAGADGFRSHQECFKSDAIFREWVLRDTYLDIDACYQHPDLVGLAEENQATRSDFSSDFSWSI